MKNKIYSFCAIAFLACMFLFSTPSKCKAQTFIAKLETMMPVGCQDPSKWITVTDGSTLTIIVVNGWGGQSAQGTINFASGDVTRTSLLKVDQYNNNTIIASNGEYLPYAIEQAIVSLSTNPKMLAITIANTMYTGTITSIIN